MKIVHVCLAGSYNDYWNYHDNLLSIQTKKDGHEVTIITTRYVNDKNSTAYKAIDSGEYIDDNGIKIIRLENCKSIPEKINLKIRKYENTYEVLKSEKPDIVYVHCPQFLDLLQVTKYLKENKQVKAFMDSHADGDNSAGNFISKNILHGMFYKTIINRSKKYFKKIFYISVECGEFLKSMYGLTKKDGIEFYTLGGNLVPRSEAKDLRNKFREEKGLTEQDRVLLHTGKLDESKGTLALLENFQKNNYGNYKLYIAGKFSDTIKDKCLKIIENNENIVFLNWLSGEELVKVMCGCDILLQPKSRSASYQQGICSGMIVILEDLPNNKFLTSYRNGFTLNHIDELDNILKTLEDKDVFNNMKKNALTFAEEELDYKSLTERLYS